MSVSLMPSSRSLANIEDESIPGKTRLVLRRCTCLHPFPSFMSFMGQIDTVDQLIHTDFRFPWHIVLWWCVET